MNPRNEKGWMIPNEGTKSRKVYQLMVDGFGSREIANLLQDDVRRIRTMASQIRNPKKKNALQSRYYYAHPKRIKETEAKSKAAGKRVGSGSYSRYVRKLVKVLGITFTEAVELERKELEKTSESNTPSNS